ncbi:MAG: glycosyltransferase family 2 protein, partial [Ignavibacteria bacterium]
AGGNNLGIKWALEESADYILVLNNDVIVDNSMVEKLVNHIKPNPGIGLVSGKVFYKDDSGRIFSGAGKFIRWRCTGVNRGTFLGRTYKHDKDCFVDYVSGVLFLARSEVFKKVGLLDERFFMYFEDLEFSRRVLSDHLISYTPEAIAYHRSGGGTRWSNYSETYLYYQTRNRIIVFEHENMFYQAYVIFFTFIVTVLKSIAIIFSVFIQNKNICNRLSALWRGLKDGISIRIHKREININ